VTAHAPVITCHRGLGPPLGLSALRSLCSMARPRCLCHGCRHELRYQFCEACTLAKVGRASFYTSDNVNSAPLQLLHMDLAGPFRTAMPKGGRWLLLALNDDSKYSWVRVMRIKLVVL
jgi:hypothetical protein